MIQSKVYLLPGLNNSGPAHWQSRWEKSFGFERIEQANWDEPVRQDWVNNIDAAVMRQAPEQVLLVAHSLACCTVAHWAREYRRNIRGALLVGPSDVEAPSYPSGTTGFAPMPLDALPFPSIVIASTDDYYVSKERAAFFAKSWGSQLIMLGAYGHINAASGLSDWPAGLGWLRQLDTGSNKFTPPKRNTEF